MKCPQPAPSASPNPPSGFGFLLSVGAPDSVALHHEDGTEITRERWRTTRNRMAAQLGPVKQLVLLPSDGSAAAIETLVAVIDAGHAVLLMASDGNAAVAAAQTRFQPGWRWHPGPGRGTLQKQAGPIAPVHPGLALLLSTSGSTGANKFVRLSAANLAANAASITEYLGLQADDRGLLTLPVHYAYGLSVLTSHLTCGAAVLVSPRSFTDRALWSFFKRHGGTNFSGVPHNWRLLDGVFDTLELPSLRFATQAGGSLGAEAVQRWATHAERAGWRFFVMYGQTEASPRMAYLPPPLAAQHPDCIGVAVPGGRLWLVDERGSEIDAPGVEGELVYAGANVMMGYASSAADLDLPAGLPVLRTGDLALRNEAGLLRITGRQSRFLKLFGLRISLDEVERRLELDGLPCICTGTDERLWVLCAEVVAPSALQLGVTNHTGLPPHAIGVLPVDALPRLPSGKPDLQAARRLAEQAALATQSHNTPPAASVRAVYAALFQDAVVADDSSFVGLGGDSLIHIEAAMELGRLIPQLPPDWPELSVAHLQGLQALQERQTPQAPSGLVVTTEMATLLRAAAMVTIVSNHLDAFKWPGGAYFLMILAGFHFARFTLPSTLRTGSVKPILGLLAGIALPTLLTIWARSVRIGEYDPLVLVLLGNWVRPEERLILYWFVEALVQLLLVLALCLHAQRLRRAAQRSPFGAPALLLVLGLVLAVLGPMLWDSSALRHWVPHMLLWMFALGWLIQAARSRTQKLLASAAVLLVPYWVPHISESVGGDVSPYAWWLWIGCLVLLWKPSLPVPRPLAQVAQTVAAASLFIYLFHNDAPRWLQRAGLELHPALEVLAGLALGVLVWRAWKLAAARAHAARKAFLRRAVSLRRRA